MVIAVLGATGQLGSELLELWGEAAVGLTREELDLSDPSTIEATLETIAPEVVVNAAAYNQVEKAESEPAAAMLVNAQGPRQLARWCASRGVRLVHVSTDFVFGSDTSRSEPYAESDETGPLGAYALSKLGGELYVRSGCPDHLVVRTCGLYGHAARRRTGGSTLVYLSEFGSNHTIPRSYPMHVVVNPNCNENLTAPANRPEIPSAHYEADVSLFIICSGLLARGL